MAKNKGDGVAVADEVVADQAARVRKDTSRRGVFGVMTRLKKAFRSLWDCEREMESAETDEQYDALMGAYRRQEGRIIKELASLTRLSDLPE